MVNLLTSMDTSNIRVSDDCSNIGFKADKESIDKQTGKYKDPLMNWPLRGAAFTNEVGEAMRPIIGKAASYSYVPALMYIGADVYDKYKNDKTEYSPNSRRGVKEAVFQGLASVGLPVIAVRAGQTAFSQLGKFTKDKISLNAKEQISNVAEMFIANGNMRAFDGKDAECVQEFVSQVLNNMDYNSKKKSIKNALNIFKEPQRKHVVNYAKNTINDLIQMRKDIINPTEAVKTGKWYGVYSKARQAGQTESVAVKSALTSFQKSKLMKGNMIKTIGGFIALALAIKPIDNFVENVLIEKFVGPKIDNFGTGKSKQK